MRSRFDESKVHPAIREKVEGYQAELIARVKGLIAAHDVVVIGMAMNPFPGKARRLLREHGVAFEYLGIGSYLSEWRTRLALKMWTGWATFPMIFVKGNLIGGFRDLKLLVESGELTALLGGGAETAAARGRVNGADA